MKKQYWASLSGGKDSLYMFNLILGNLDKYPLDGVVYFDLEIDFPFIKNVMREVEEKCKANNIRYLAVKPNKSWEEYYNKYLYPTRVKRWCNDKYKLSAKKIFIKMMQDEDVDVVFYVGYCADEKTRYEKRRGKERYPLVEEEIREETILQWARREAVFNEYYVTQKRAGCMGCPMSSRINFAYVAKYYPQQFEDMISKMRDTEARMEAKLGRPFSAISSNPKYNANYLERNVREKWVPILEKREKEMK